MSLLMQALKKAEQTKQKQQSDAVLSLSPNEVNAGPTLQNMPETNFHPTLADENDLAGPTLALHDKTDAADIVVEPIPALTQTSDAILENMFVSPPAPVTQDNKEKVSDADNNHTLEDRISRPRIDIEQVKASENANRAQAAEQQKAKSVFSSKSPQVQHRRLWIFSIGSVALLMLTGFAYVFWQSSQIENRYSQIVQIPTNPVPLQASMTSPPEPASVTAVGDSSSSSMKTGSSIAASTLSSAAINSSDSKNTSTDSEPNSTGNKVNHNQSIGVSAKARKSDDQAGQKIIDTDSKTVTPQSQLAKESRGIQIRKGSSDAQIHPALNYAYQAFLAGDTAKAEQQYQIVLNQEANNRDALIGLAAIALNQRNAEKAGAYYGKLLELDPNDPDAIAGLTSLQQGDPVQSESRLKKALNQHPNAGAILFALGNLYAQQTRWSDAQQNYFRAYTTQPSNADYAYNLAISLDRLNQIKLAKEYYQRALDAGQSGPGNFNRSSVQKRIAELDKAVNDIQ